MNVLKGRCVNYKDAVMFDIDNTLIFTNGRPNYKAIQLLNDCVKLGYRIIIMTARPNIPGVLLLTKFQLYVYGIYYDELYITPAHNKGNLKRRTGYNYVLSVGDRDTDLTHSKYAIKIST
jgi:phosphoglycolate phosphatase-like HAD superfamily hydrolase